MAQIGYIYQCCWCGKEIAFVEQCQSKQQLKYIEKSKSMEIYDAKLVDHQNTDNDNKNKKQRRKVEVETETKNDNDNDNDDNKQNQNSVIDDNLPSVQQQCRVILNSLLTKWKASEGIPNHTEDGPSYSRVPFSLNDLRIKDRIMASDGTNWLPGWIEKIDKHKKNPMNNKVLIHFKGWNARWDKWYNINSGMLKTVNEYRKEKNYILQQGMKQFMKS